MDEPSPGRHPARMEAGQPALYAKQLLRNSFEWLIVGACYCHFEPSREISPKPNPPGVPAMTGISGAEMMAKPQYQRPDCGRLTTHQAEDDIRSRNKHQPSIRDIWFGVGAASTPTPTQSRVIDFRLRCWSSAPFKLIVRRSRLTHISDHWILRRLRMTTQSASSNIIYTRYDGHSFAIAVEFNSAVEIGAVKIDMVSG
jgi:hypothetical protein